MSSKDTPKINYDMLTPEERQQIDATSDGPSNQPEAADLSGQDNISAQNENSENTPQNTLSETVISESEIANNPDEFDESEQEVDFSQESERDSVGEKKAKKGFSLIKFFLIIIVVFFAGLALFGTWNRWFRYDDAADLVSTWQVHGTNSTVVIDGKQIHLDKDTVFNYEIDPFAKVVFLSTGNYTGTCHYRFSWDRCQVAFVDSCGMDGFSTAFSDICWFSDLITCKMSGIGISPAYTKETGQDVDTSNTGIEDIISNGNSQSILLDKVSTKKTTEE